MKTIFNFLIIAHIYTSKCSVYDWNVKTIERDSDFGDELKVQTALNNELQNDLMKISGKLDNKNENDDIYFTKQYNFKNNDADMNRNIQDQYEYKFDGKYDDNILQNDNHRENSGRKHNLKDNQSDKYNDEDNSDIKQHRHKSSNKKYGDKYNRHNDSIHHQNQHIVIDHINHKNNGKNNYDHNHKVSSDKNDYNDTDNKDNNSQNDHRYTNNHVPNNTDHHNNYDKEDNTDAKNENSEGDQINNKIEEDKKTNNDNEENYALISHCPAKAPDIENFVGTNLFDNMPKQCFSNEELALLNTRRDFESLLPKDLPQCLLNDRMLALLMNYFYTCHQLIIQITSNGSKELAQKAFYDTLGGYLNFYLVPVAKYSYYGGHISLDAVQNVLTLHQQCKKYLNTNGNGWKSPLQNVLDELQTIRIEPLHINGDEKSETSSFCMHLDMNTEQNEPDDDKMIVPIPKLEAEDINNYLGNVWLPFRRKKTFDLKSGNSAYVLVKFYETLTKCYQFEKIPQNSYNQKFRTWLLENIHVHLSDEQFYPGLGAVLRIYEYIKRGKKEVTSYGDDLGDLEYEDEGKTTKARDTQNRTKDTRKIHEQSDRKSKEFLDVLNKSKLKEKSGIWIDNNYDKEESENNRNQFNQNSKEEKEVNTKENISNKPLKNDSLKDVELITRAEAAHSNKPILNLRTLEFSRPQIAVISILIVAIILIILICCYKCCFKKKKPVVQVKSTKGKKNSSSSSSNLINSPVRFFYVKPKSASGKSITSMNYSSSEPTGKKVKKTVKIQQKAIKDRDNNHTDTSASSSPTKKKKGKNKDSAKSSSKSSWETTYSSK